MVKGKKNRTDITQLHDAVTAAQATIYRDLVGALEEWDSSELPRRQQMLSLLSDRLGELTEATLTMGRAVGQQEYEVDLSTLLRISYHVEESKKRRAS